MGEKSTIAGIAPDATRKQAVEAILAAEKIELEGNDVDGKADPGVSIFEGDYFLGETEHRSAMAGQWGVIRVGESGSRKV